MSRSISLPRACRSATDLALAQRMFEKLERGEDVRHAKIARVKRGIASNRYDEERMVDSILDRVLDDLS